MGIQQKNRDDEEGFSFWDVEERHLSEYMGGKRMVVMVGEVW